MSESRSQKYLTFHLAEEEYGLDILRVQEIIATMRITRIPRTQEFVLGVINLRGKVIPIVDLRRKFGMDAVDPTDQTCIIVVEVGSVRTGIMVDKVFEVVADIAPESIEPTPSFAADVHTEFIRGIGKFEDRVLLLLDIEKVLSREEIADVHEAAELGHSVTG